MKNLLMSLFTIFISFFFTFFCLDNSLNTNNTKENFTSTANEISENSINVSDITVDYETWKNYYKENIDLSINLIGIDEDGNEITKDDFLKKLKTGNYIPIKLLNTENKYQLSKLDGNKEKISKSIKSSANGFYKYFLKEGKSFPEFNFKDIHDNSFSKKDALGKTLVIKCWFIQCRTCVEEFPILNELYDRYEVYDDVIFLSLTFDKPDKLKKFLAKKEFRYPVVAEQKKFIKDEIGVIQYPAHIIVDKKGNIHKIVNNVDSLVLALDDITGK